MEKLKKATKRIAAVGAIGLYTAATAFGAGLGSYPNNFVEDGKFVGKVVVGTGVGADDTTAANSIIEDLKAEFSGETEKVRITYKKVADGGDEFNVVKSNAQLNYGESIGDSDVTETLDNGDVDFLADGKFKNGVSDEDYTQEIDLSNGEFNHALRDNVDGVHKISDNIYYSSGDSYLTYTLTLDNSINLTGMDSADFIGETLNIMGNEFTISSISHTGADLTELELIGGANKVSLGEGETTKVTVDGKSYDIAIQSVSDTKVLMTVNGQSKSVDELDTEDIAGVSIAVTDLVSSSRDSVKGYAEIVVGGQKIKLQDNNREVQVNEDDVSDLYDGYIVTSDFGTEFSTITITYKTDDDVSLEAGDSLIDPLFGGFSLVFDGTNNPDYSTTELRVNDDDIKVEGELISGDSLNRDFLHYSGTNGTDGAVYLKGNQDADRIFTANSVNLTTSGAWTPDGGLDDTLSGAVNISLDNTGIKGSGFFVYEDAENQYLYELSSVNTVDEEVDVDELLGGKDKSALSGDDLLTKLDNDLTGSTFSSPNVTLSLAGLDVTGNDYSKLGFANEAMMDFSAAEADVAGADAITDSTLTFALDSDVSGDETTDEADTFNVTLGWDSSDTELNLMLDKTAADFVNKGDADAEDGNSDVQEYVTAYGFKVIYDNDKNTYVKVMTPDKQVYAKVNLVTGGSVATVATVDVAAADLDAKKTELEDDGYTIVSTETLAAEDVEFDVTGVTLDTDAAGMDDLIVVGGPAVNAVARDLLGIELYTIDQAGVEEGEGVIKYFAESNNVLVYGYSKADTVAAVTKLNAGGLSGDEETVN